MPWFRRVPLQWFFRRSDGAIPFVLKTSILAWAATVGILATIDAVFHLPDPPDNFVSAADELISNLVIAPLFENFIMAGVIEFLTALRCRSLTIVLTVAATSGSVHAVAHSWRGIAGSIVFATMAYSYLAWTEYSAGRRLMLTVGQHALFNAPATLVALMTH